MSSNNIFQKVCDHWMILEPYVYLKRANNSEVLLYNEHSNEMIIKNSSTIYKLMSKFEKEGNFRIVTLNHKDLTGIDIRNFIIEGRNKYMLDILPKERIKPVQFIPRVTLKDHKAKKSDENYGKNILYNINEIFFLFGKYVNPTENSVLTINQQLPYYYNANCEIDISISKLKSLLKELSNSTLSKIHIVGHNIFSNSRYIEILHTLGHWDYTLECYLNINLINIQVFNTILQYSHLYNFRINLIIDDISSENNVKFKSIDQKVIINYIFIIQSVTDLTRINEIIEENNISRFSIVPFFNSNNLSLFKKHVYTSLSDIKNLNPTLLELYRNQEINSTFFGNLFVDAKGKIKSNINSSTLGQIGIHTVKEITNKEMVSGKNWFKVRKNFSPCSHLFANGGQILWQKL